MSIENNGRLVAALEDVRDAESVEELEALYDESAELRDVDEFVAAYAARKLELSSEDEEKEVVVENKREEKEVVVNSKDEELRALAGRIEELKKLLDSRKDGKKKVAKYKGQGYRLLKIDMESVTAPQAVTVVEILDAIGAGKRVVTEKEAIEAMERNRELFEITGEKQTATHIFKYYRPQLRDAGVIEIVRVTDRKVAVA